MTQNYNFNLDFTIKMWRYYSGYALLLLLLILWATQPRVHLSKQWFYVIM